MADQDTPAFPLPDVDGHRFTLLPEGPERLEALIALIAAAEHSLRLLYYIFLDDTSSTRVRDALLAAHHRGVKVSLLVDGFGSEDAGDDFFAPLEQADCAFCRFEPTHSRRFLIRNHQKLAVADDRKAIVGGFNVDDGYFAAFGSDGWRDLGIAFEGPAAKRLSAYFDDIHGWSSHKKAAFEDLRTILHTHHEQDDAVRWVFGGPTRELSPWAQSLRNDLYAADRIDMIAAYFAPHMALMRPICNAAAKGCARLITASKSDNNATIAAARNRYQYLLPDVEIYEYQPMKMHTKLYIAGDVVYIGSANFDVRSLYLNLEMMLRVHDADFAEAMRAYVDHEVADSKRITPELYAQQNTLWNRIKNRLSYFLISVLDYNVSRRLNFGLDGQ